jgi:UDP-glucose:(heptosyl)LPS alpha-1,3-glucosyltransferase
MSDRRKLKIAVLIKSFISTGGAERYALEVTRRLALEHDVHVFANRWSLDGNEKITFHRIPIAITKPGFLSELLFSRLCRKYVDPSYDIIHAHVRATHFDVSTVHAPCFRNIITRHKNKWKRLSAQLSSALSLRESAWLWLEKKQFTFSKQRLFVAVSENLKRDIQANYSLPDESFRIAYPGVDIGIKEQIHAGSNVDSLRSKLGIEEDELIFLFVGTEFKRKGLDALLQGLALILPSKVRLIVAGGEERRIEKYKDLAKKLDLTEHVLFLGLVQKVEELYAISHAFILPTLSDPFGMAPVEAMLCGVPAAFSGAELCGAAELVKNEEALIIDDPWNPQEIAGALRKLMDADFRAELGQRGQALAAELTWEKTTASTLSAYAEVLRRKHVLKR